MSINVCRVHNSKDSDSLITKALAFILQVAVFEVACQGQTNEVYELRGLVRADRSFVLFGLGR